MAETLLEWVYEMGLAIRPRTPSPYATPPNEPRPYVINYGPGTPKNFTLQLGYEKPQTEAPEEPRQGSLDL